MDIDSVIVGGCIGWLVGFLCAVWHQMGTRGLQRDTEANQ